MRSHRTTPGCQSSTTGVGRRIAGIPTTALGAFCIAICEISQLLCGRPAAASIEGVGDPVQLAAAAPGAVKCAQTGPEGVQDSLRPGPAADLHCG